MKVTLGQPTVMRRAVLLGGAADHIAYMDAQAAEVRKTHGGKDIAFSVLADVGRHVGETPS